jgi:hypothetical protein
MTSTKHLDKSSLILRFVFVCALLTGCSGENPNPISIASESNSNREIMIFPTVQGSNLLRQKKTLPQDFEGELNLVFVPFLQWQQSEVDSWVPWIVEMEAKYPGFLYYELPTIENRNILFQTFINEGMRVGIPNSLTRERTITLYLKKAEFQKSLDMSDEDHIYILMLDNKGNILLRSRGPFTKESGEIFAGLVENRFKKNPSD